MKTQILTSLFILFLSGIILGQAPQAFQYQAIARDAAGNILINNPIGIRISMVEGNKDGMAKYVETQQVKTNPYGVINLVIGEGDVVKGDFADIKWGEDSYFVKMEMDITGGTDYEEIGISQLYAIPYALYAEEAGHLKQAESVNQASQVSAAVKSRSSGSGPRLTPNSKISSSGDSWLNALTGNVGIGTALPSAQLEVNGVVLSSLNKVQALSSGAVAMNIVDGHHATITLTSNTTITFTGLYNGAKGFIVVTQDGTGGWTLAITGGITAGGSGIVLTGTPASVDLIPWFYDGTNLFVNANQDFQ